MTEGHEALARVREWSERLRASLPQSVHVASLGVKSKAPYQLLITREALMWRTEEMTRNACDALGRQDFAAAALLGRAVIENAAVVWKLLEILQLRLEQSADEREQHILSILMGSKIWKEFPDPIQILNLIDKMNKKIPGIRRSYDSLSEIVHPNWAGVVGLYARHDMENYATFFGRSVRKAHIPSRLIVNALLGALGAFEYAYNKISDELPVFLSKLEKL